MPRSDGRTIASLLRNLHTVFRRDWASLHSHHLWQGFPFVYILIALLFVFLMTAVLALKSLEVEYFVVAALETYYITRK